MSDSTPRVSVLTPAYKPDHFAQAVASVLAQTLVDFEFVICDDSPGREIADIAQQLAGADPRVRYVRNPQNLGDRANYLRCFELARGRHIKYLNDDDLLAPTCLELMSAALDAHPDVTLVTSWRQLIDGAGAPLPTEVFNRPLVRHDSRVSGRGLLDLMLRRGVNVIGEPTTVMFRRDDLADNTPDLFSFAGRTTSYNVDTYMWTALLAKGEAIVFAEALSLFRQHGEQAQRGPDFLKPAVAAWHALTRAAIDTGVYDPERPQDLDATALDPVQLKEDEALAAALAAGRAAVAINDMAGAEAVYHRILERWPRCAEALNDLGAVHWFAQRTGRALDAWQRALAIDPGLADAAVNLIQALAAAGGSDQARSVGQQFLRLTPWSQDIRQLMVQTAVVPSRSSKAN